MPRNISGFYTLPLPPVVPGTVIESVWANTTLDDIAQAITNSLSRDGEGGMNYPFRIADGTVGAPGLAFVAETGSGLFRESAGVIGMSVLGVKKQQWSASGVTIWGDITQIGGGGDGLGTYVKRAGDIMSGQLRINGADLFVGGTGGKGALFAAHTDGSVLAKIEAYGDDFIHGGLWFSTAQGGPAPVTVMRLSTAGNLGLYAQNNPTPRFEFLASDLSSRAYISMITETSGTGNDENRFYQGYGFKTFYTSGLESLRITPEGGLTLQRAGITFRDLFLAGGNVYQAGDRLSQTFNDNNGAAPAWISFNRNASVQGGGVRSSSEIRFITTSSSFVNDAAGPSDKLIIAGSGNVGMSINPHPWGGQGLTLQALQVRFSSFAGLSTSPQTYITTNTYLANGVWTAMEAGASAIYAQNGAGTHSWYMAPAVAAGAVTTTLEKFRVDATGAVIVFANNLISADNPPFQVGGTKISHQFQGVGDVAIDTIQDGNTGGGGLLVIQGANGNSGIGFGRAYVWSGTVPGGSASAVGMTLIGSHGSVPEAFTMTRVDIGGGQLRLRITATGTQGGAWRVSYFVY